MNRVISSQCCTQGGGETLSADESQQPKVQTVCRSGKPKHRPQILARLELLVLVKVLRPAAVVGRGGILPKTPRKVPVSLSADASRGVPRERDGAIRSLISQLQSETYSIRKGGWYGWRSSSSSDLSILVFVQAYPLIGIRQTVPCRATRGSAISVSSTLPPLLM